MWRGEARGGVAIEGEARLEARGERGEAKVGMGEGRGEIREGRGETRDTWEERRVERCRGLCHYDAETRFVASSLGNLALWALWGAWKRA